jgi:hypothetical protein
MGVNCNSPGHTAEPVEVPGSKDISNEEGKRLVCIERLKGIIQNKYIEYICSREYRIYPSICCFLKHAGNLCSSKPETKGHITEIKETYGRKR